MDALAQGLLGDADTMEKRLRLLPVPEALLEGFPILHNIFVGYKNGDIFMVSHLHADKFRQRLSAPEGSVLVVTTAKAAPHPRMVENFFFDKNLKLIGQNQDTASLPDAIYQREWYAEGMRSEGRVKTKPILLSGTKQAAIEFIQNPKRRCGAWDIHFA